MNSENLIISNEWSLNDDETELKIIHRGQESVYKPSRDVIMSIDLTSLKGVYFGFDDNEIVLMYDADTSIIRPLHVNKENILVVDERSMRASHVSMQFTRFLFEEFLRNCGL